MLVGSCFNHRRFTCSVEQARASLSTGVHSRRTAGSSECFMQQIQCCVVVTIKHHTARLTNKGTLLQSQFRLYVSARGTGLAGRIKAVYDHKVCPVEFSLVGELPPDLPFVFLHRLKMCCFLLFCAILFQIARLACASHHRSRSHHYRNCHNLHRCHCHMYRNFYRKHSHRCRFLCHS